MFQKAFRVKSQTAIKGSERKHLRTEFERQYAGHVTSAQCRSIVPGSKVDMMVTKLSTHAGDTVQVYSVLGNPIIFEVHKVLYPTVYMLWQHPAITLTTFTTWPPVLTKLQSGADLMLPGVVLPRSASSRREPTGDINSPGDGMEFPLGKFARNHGCAINLDGNRYCVAVGKTAMSSEEMRSSEMKGKGVIVLHTYGDLLWAMGDKSKLPADSTSSHNVYNTDDEDEEDVDLGETRVTGAVHVVHGGASVDSQPSDLMHPADVGAAAFANLSLEQSSGGKHFTREHVEDRVQPSAVDVGDAFNGHGNTETVCSQESHDELLQQCFLQALKAYKKKPELPVLTSTFFRNHILPCCPKGMSLDVKKTSYKKLGKFLAAKKTEGFLEVKELTKGVESIIDIYWDNDVLRSFKMPPTTDASSLDDDDDQGAANGFCGASGGDVPFSYVPPQIVDVYLVSPASLPLLGSLGKKKNEALTGPAVRQLVVDYVRDNGLKDATNETLVRLDPPLCDAALDRGEYVETLTWEELQSRILTRMTRGYEITRSTGVRPEVRKGAPEQIRLDVVQRGANKKVTLVHNLEVYGIDPAEFAALVQHGVACSASVSAESGKNKGSQVLVQGNQVKYIASLLTEKYKLAARYIAGLDKAPKGKKK